MPAKRALERITVGELAAGALQPASSCGVDRTRRARAARGTIRLPLYQRRRNKRLHEYVLADRSACDVRPVRGHRQ
jgi:hypothetical protein